MEDFKSDMLFEVTFKVRIAITNDQIEEQRRGNRNFISHGLFAKDINVAQVLAYNRAMEKIAKMDPDVRSDIQCLNTGDINFNIQK